MKRLLILLSITVVSQADHVFKNLYGTTAFNEKLWNSLQTSIGISKIAYDFIKYAYEETLDKTPDDGEVFDFIVVGAGTTGATIASRLSEIPEFSVILIEAGGSENIVMDIPIIVHYLQFSDDTNWKYQTEPSDNYCTAMVDKRCNWPRGKVMGGSSVLNYMIATRGHPSDYDRWAELGNDGWSWDDVLPYFKKLESFNIPTNEMNTEAHNNNGPVHLNYTKFQTPLAQAFLEAGLELGYKANIDYNSGSESIIGFSYLQTNVKNGLRMSSNVAYLHPAKLRKNLTVTKNSLVARVLFDANNRRAIGVEYIKGNRKYRVYARKEVILSAGAIGSPQILMLSGIGHAEHLKKHNIFPIVDLPVGDNLMDHIAYGGLIFTVNQPVGIRESDLMNPLNPYLQDYLLHRNGPLTIPGGCEALALLNVDTPNYQNVTPNIELLFVSSSFASISSVRFDFGISDETWKKTYSQLENTYTWTIYPLLLKPKSRGRIRLRDNNIYSKPKLFANYMDDKEDVRLLIEGVKAAIRVSKTEAMQKYGTKLFNARLPQCEELLEGSDDFWECAIRAVTMTSYHFSGTCKMGPKDDPMAVVDSKLRVYGIEGLRVADVSIMPEIPTAHTNIPAFMIGEKLSDMVKEEWES